MNEWTIIYYFPAVDKWLKSHTHTFLTLRGDIETINLIIKYALHVCYLKPYASCCAGIGKAETSLLGI